MGKPIGRSGGTASAKPGRPPRGDAVAQGVKRACKTLDNVTSVWVQEMKADVQDGHISAYRVNMKITFVLND